MYIKQKDAMLTQQQNLAPINMNPSHLEKANVF